MPGIFGGLGLDRSTFDALEREFARGWPRVERRRVGGALVGGHAFAPGGALHAASDGRLIAVDGDRPFHRVAADALRSEPSRIFHAFDDGIELNQPFAGNIAVVEPSAGLIDLAVDWSGTYPLYFARRENGLLFSSLLRPLARAVRAPRDDLGTLEFLRQAYTVMGKTPFAGIRRLLPGQSLRYRHGGGVRIRERSLAWLGQGNGAPATAAETVWSLLRDNLDASLPAEGTSALMMSAGWDSRTLLAAARRGVSAGRIACYSHGDTASRELRLVDRICQDWRTPCHLEPIDDRVLDPDALDRAFERVETVVFPHWHRAGAALAEAGVACVFAGVYGEILGGHYGPAMLAGKGHKVLGVASALLGRGEPVSDDGADARDVGELFRLDRLGRHWYLDAEYERAVPHRLERMNADIDRAVDRFARRGVTRPTQLVEAFIAEHRGTQYINAQLLSCRAHTDVAMPFTDRRLFAFATRLPLSLKIHNRLNQAVLRRYAPSLLRYPLAATLVPARAPILAQEASRLVRSIRERSHWRIHFGSGGWVRPPRLGWVNFEFLRSGRALRRIIEDLRCDIWDRAALEGRVRAIERGEWKEPLHPIYDQVSKVYTVDLMLRR